MQPSKKEIMAALNKVMDPELGRSLVELNMIRDLVINDGRVTFTLALTVPSCPMRTQMQAAARQAVLEVTGVTEVEVALGAMTPEERAAVLGSAQPVMPQIKAFNQVKRMIAVMSGKGGVGKSTVTAMLAVEMQLRGEKVGILDADITGPSIPRLFGLPAGGLRGSDEGMLPSITATGIRVISANLLLRDEDTPIVWRGPMIAAAIRQFWTDALWGKLDTLLVDLPPGTSDATLTVAQSLPLNGAIMVTSPQSLAAMVVRKSVLMLKQLNVPILGVVENMSYFTCPECGKPHAVFGDSHAGEVAAAAEASVLARLPIRPEVLALADAGKIEEAVFPEVADLVTNLAVL